MPSESAVVQLGGAEAYKLAAEDRNRRLRHVTQLPAVVRQNAADGKALRALHMLWYLYIGLFDVILFTPYLIAAESGLAQEVWDTWTFRPKWWHWFVIMFQVRRAPRSVCFDCW